MTSCRACRPWCSLRAARSRGCARFVGDRVLGSTSSRREAERVARRRCAGRGHLPNCVEVLVASDEVGLATPPRPCTPSRPGRVHVGEHRDPRRPRGRPWLVGGLQALLAQDSSTALSMSPPVSLRAALQSIIGAPVCLRSCHHRLRVDIRPWGWILHSRKVATPPGLTVVSTVRRERPARRHSLGAASPEPSAGASGAGVSAAGASRPPGASGAGAGVSVAGAFVGATSRSLGGRSLGRLRASSGASGAGVAGASAPGAGALHPRRRELPSPSS